MAIELKIPAVGESITEVVVGEWLKKEGDHVEEDESIVVIETDKATVELPAPTAGKLSKILKKEGEDAAVGDVVGYLEAEGEGEESAEEEEPEKEEPAEEESEPEEDAEGEGEESEEEDSEDEEPRITPAARRALADAGLDASEVKATGPGGRLLKEDVQRAQKEKGSKEKGQKETAKAPEAPEPEWSKPEPKKETAAPKAAPAAQPAPSQEGRQEEAVRMTTLRKKIAERLVEAQQTAALLTTFNEVDMSAVMELRRRYQDSFQKKYGIKVGFMSFFIKAVIEGLKEIPALNAEIRDGQIIYRNYYDVGVAVGGGRGLVVPVIRNAERLSFAELEKTIADLAGRARDNQITPEELQGGTFTISNGGIYGSMLSTPIVNPPQSGILGMHNIKDRPVAIDGQVVIRPIMYVALTYDHRLVDGREAVTFLVRVKDCIEEPARMLIEA